MPDGGGRHRGAVRAFGSKSSAAILCFAGGGAEARRPWNIVTVEGAAEATTLRSVVHKKLRVRGYDTIARSYGVRPSGRRAIKSVMMYRRGNTHTAHRIHDSLTFFTIECIIAVNIA